MLTFNIVTKMRDRVIYIQGCEPFEDIYNKVADNMSDLFGMCVVTVGSIQPTERLGAGSVVAPLVPRPPVKYPALPTKIEELSDVQANEIVSFLSDDHDEVEGPSEDSDVTVPCTDEDKGTPLGETTVDPYAIIKPRVRP